MDIRQLKTFVDVAANGSYARTALIVGIAQSALSRQLSMTPEALLLMAQDLMDVPWEYLEPAITGWRRGTLRMGRPEQMDRFPTVRQLRLQAELLELEGGL